MSDTRAGEDTRGAARRTVVVTRKLPTAVEQEIAAQFDARLNPDDTPLDADGLKAAMRSADAIVTCVADRVTADILNTPNRRVKLVANYGVGFNNIDIEAAKAAGVSVSNTPDVLTEATADLAMTLLLMTARRAGEGERLVRQRQWTGWRPTHMMGTMVTGKTLGLVGFGRIARAVTKKAHDGFGMRVIFHDPLVAAGALGAEPRPTLEAVLRESDFVSLHCPALPETRHLMNAERFEQMKPSAFLINTARGDVVDEAALVAALERGRIAGAGLDVYEREPAVTPALLSMENVVLLPHLGSATLETREAMGRRALENIVRFFAGQPLRDRVV
jgi:lactate dehydrogenase-like 2-hydroxyacid dehydrogenase